jgi:hypothetical protein
VAWTTVRSYSVLNGGRGADGRGPEWTPKVGDELSGEDRKLEETSGRRDEDIRDAFGVHNDSRTEVRGGEETTLTFVVVVGVIKK